MLEAFVGDSRIFWISILKLYVLMHLAHFLKFILSEPSQNSFALGAPVVTSLIVCQINDRRLLYARLSDNIKVYKDVLFSLLKPSACCSPVTLGITHVWQIVVSSDIRLRRVRYGHRWSVFFASSQQPKCCHCSFALHTDVTQ